MHKSIRIIFSILILLILILSSACVIQSSNNQTTQQDIGLTQITAMEDYSHISFDGAKARLIEYRLNRMNESGNATIVHYMRSRDLDEMGNATGWIFGVFNGPDPIFLVYDKTGWTSIGNATFPSEEIALDSVVSPDFVLKNNKEIISGNPPVAFERRDMELQQGIYTLTITSNSITRILTFNATTGALIT